MKKRVLMIIALIALVAVLGVVLAACNESTTDDPAGSIDYDVRQNVTLAFMILMLIAGIALIVVVMMQRAPTTTSESYRERPTPTTAETRKRAKRACSRKSPSHSSHSSSCVPSSASWSARSTETRRIQQRLPNGSRFYFVPDRNNANLPQSNSFRRFCTAETCQYVSIGGVPPEQNHPKISCSEVRAVRHRRTGFVLFRSGIFCGNDADPPRSNSFRRFCTAETC